MQSIKRLKKPKSTVNYQILLEPELKMRLTEFKLFYDIDVPEEIRQLIRDWVVRVEESLNFYAVTKRE